MTGGTVSSNGKNVARYYINIDKKNLIKRPC
jgi:hypothetical protein